MQGLTPGSIRHSLAAVRQCQRRIRTRWPEYSWQMPTARKIVLHSRSGLRPGLDALVAEWMREGVQYVGVVGVDAEDIVEAIDWFCIGDGTDP